MKASMKISHYIDALRTISLLFFLTFISINAHSLILLNLKKNVNILFKMTPFDALRDEFSFALHLAAAWIS